MLDLQVCIPFLALRLPKRYIYMYMTCMHTVRVLYDIIRYMSRKIASVVRVMSDFVFHYFLMKNIYNFCFLYTCTHV